ncbi:MAG: hypothetical protein P8Y42_07465 [Exilibacterium sp.]
MNTLSKSLDVKEAVPLRQYEDDFSLLDIIQSIGKIWKQWLVALVLVALAYMGYSVIQYLKVSKVPVYRKVIEFTFPGVEKSQYPNGSRFSLEDLIAPVVVNEVYDINNLHEYGISVDQFRTALTVEPYVPHYFMIIEKYDRLLNTKRIKTPELENLQDRLQAELSVASKGAAVLSLYLNKISLPETVVEKVVTQIPEVWARRSIWEKGVLKLNIKLATSKAIDTDLSGQVDYMLISDYLTQKTALVDGNIEKLLQLADAALIVDQKSGLRLADIQQELNDLRRYVIDEVMSPVRSLGLSRNPDMALYYYEDKRRTFQSKLELLKNQAALVKNALDRYTANSWAEPIRGRSVGNNGTVNQQFSSGAIDKIISLSSNVKSEEFRQKLNRQWLDIEMQYAQLKHDIGETDRLIGALKNSGKNVEKVSIKEQYLTRAEEKLPEILERLREYLDVTHRIYQQVSMENVGINDRLYRALSNKPFVKKTNFSIKKKLMILAVMLFLTSLVVVPILMIHNALRKRVEISGYN